MSRAKHPDVSHLAADAVFFVRVSRETPDVTNTMSHLTAAGSTLQAGSSYGMCCISPDGERSAPLRHMLNVQPVLYTIDIEQVVHISDLYLLLSPLAVSARPVLASRGPQVDGERSSARRKRIGERGSAPQGGRHSMVFFNPGSQIPRSTSRLS